MEPPRIFLDFPEPPNYGFSTKFSPIMDNQHLISLCLATERGLSNTPNQKSCTREPKHQKQPRPTLAPVGTSQTESCTNTPAAPKLAKRFKPTRG